jgi:XTP/dITP diphosphohydrolase
VKIVLASGNAGKLRELAAMLAPLGHEVLSQSAFGIETPPETGATFVENALLKARYAAGRASLPALADDSAIEVDALGGRPGVHSARYAGKGATDQQNLEKMLEELRGVPAERRTARYQCVIALARSADDSNPLIAQGTWEGRVLATPRGSGGFGYDPIFQPEGLTLTAAELPATEKNARSHRGQALRALSEKLRGLATSR